MGTCLNNLGRLYEECGQLDRGIALHRKAVALRQDVLGDHEDTAFSLGNLGVALASGMIDGITVNAGGDLLHVGEEPLVVGIENPHRPYDNEPPLVRITLQTGAVATSGGARRGWTIDGTWYSHVIDPRTGEPVDHVAQASVVAPHASRADAVATILTVMAPHEGAAFANSLGDVGFMLVGSDGSITNNGYWKSREIN